MTLERADSFAEIGTPTNPFPGLRPFEFEESHLFFGRDGQSEQLISKLRRTHFVAVVGASGSGKSSLLRAGLFPTLLGGFMTSAGSHWRIAMLRPGYDPIGNLARALNSPDVFGGATEEDAVIQIAITESILRRGPLALAEIARQAGIPSHENLLIVVDSFEEIFRFAQASGSEDYENSAAAFVKLLLGTARQRDVPIYVALTMRSDFLGDCAEFWDLPEAINEGQYLIPRLKRDQRREAIVGPIAVCSGEITPRLVNRLLNDEGDNPDQLPILQHALMRTWDEWKKDHDEKEPIDLRHYEAIGGMADALSRDADEAFDELPTNRSRQIGEGLFKCLTEKGLDNREICRPVALAEICAVVDAAEPEVIAVIQSFSMSGRSLLLPPAGTALEDNSLIDVSHESLIRGWARLKAWVEEEAHSARIYRRLAETAALHREGSAGLWRDPDLQLALAWRERNNPNQVWGRRYHPDFDLAMDFLEQSRHAREAEILESEWRRKREIRIARILSLMFALAFILLLVVALLVWRNGRL